MGIWPVSKESKFNRILVVRWTGQLTDGLFQSALASFVLFSPERAPDAVSAAVAFAVVLLPYSLIGPYVGTFLDRFSRQRIIRNANFFRAANLLIIAALVSNGVSGVLLTFSVLLAFGINRLILAGLSAGLPLLVTKEELIAANALAVTGGTIFVVIGGGLGIAFKNLVDHINGADNADAAVILIAALGFFVAALSTYRLKKFEIGPHEHEISNEVRGYKEMLEGFHILREHKDALRGIVAIGVQRGGITALTLMALLLERNLFNPSNNPDAGLAGFGVALGIAGVGIGVGAVISPYGVIRFGRHLWMRILIFAAIPWLVIFAFNISEPMMIVCAFFVGLFGQGMKVTNDALVQSKIDDEYRGRVFAFYDVAVNAGIVVSAIIAAFVLPKNGDSTLLPILIATAYLLTGLIIMKKSTFSHSTK